VGEVARYGTGAQVRDRSSCEQQAQQRSLQQGACAMIYSDASR
jgi:hypothetical protein